MNEYEGDIYKRDDSIDLKQNEFLDCKFLDKQEVDSDLTSAKFMECEFKNCNLSNSIVRNTTFRDVTFLDCKMIGINWANTQNFTHVKFVNCILDYGIFQNMKILGAHFENCSLREADFAQSNLKNAIFVKSLLTNCSFNGCDLEKADFRFAKDFFIDPSFTNIKKAVFSMPEAVNLLKAFDIIIKD